MDALEVAGVVAVDGVEVAVVRGGVVLLSGTYTTCIILRVALPYLSLASSVMRLVPGAKRYGSLNSPESVTLMGRPFMVSEAICKAMPWIRTNDVWTGSTTSGTVICGP